MKKSVEQMRKDTIDKLKEISEEASDTIDTLRAVKEQVLKCWDRLCLLTTLLMAALAL